MQVGSLLVVMAEDCSETEGECAHEGGLDDQVDCTPGI